jgi:hypothetical protein
MTQKALLQSAGDGSAAPASYVGETIYSALASPISLSANTSYTLATISNLTAGTWILFGSIKCDTVTGSGPSIVAILKSGATTLQNSHFGMNTTGRVNGNSSLFSVINVVSSAIPTITLTIDVIGSSVTAQGYAYEGQCYLRAIRIA